jgi:RecA/RadA recombinase
VLDESAGTSLRAALTELRRALGPAAGYARATRETVALDGAGLMVDARSFERALDRGDAAVAAGRQFAERLRAGLGIPPSRETRALLDELRRAATAHAVPPTALARAYDSEFVGRRAELERMSAARAGVQDALHRRIVLVAGEPGVGKTRLVHQFAGAALEQGRHRARGPLLGGAAGTVRAVPEALRQAGAPDALEPTDADAAGARHHLFDAVDRTFTDLAARAPLLLIVDDLHSADRGTLLLANFLLRSSRPAPILVAGTYRDTELGRRSPLTAALADLQRDGALDRIALRGLAPDDVAALARSLLGGDALAPRVHARTHGNAFFVEEVLKGLAESDTREVPESVRHAVGVRLSALARTPTSCSRRRRSSVSSTTRGRCRRPPGSSPNGPAYEDAAERFDRAREALELADAEDEAGGVLLARGDALLRAGEPRAARAAFGEQCRVPAAQRKRSRREEALASAEDTARRSRLQARLAVELYYAPERQRSELLSAEAVAAAREASDASALASALNARHVALWRPDRVADRLDVADEMIAAARAAGERHSELQARNWRVTDLFELGDMPACHEEIARHGRLADELRLPTFQWYAPLWAAAAATLAGRFEDAEALTARAREAGTRAGDDNAVLFCEMVRFVVHAERQEFDRVDMAFLEDKLSSSPAGPAYRSAYAWILAGAARPTAPAASSTRRWRIRTRATRTGSRWRPGARRRRLAVIRSRLTV